jgi:hypothetical protein
MGLVDYEPQPARLAWPTLCLQQPSNATNYSGASALRRDTGAKVHYSNASWYVTPTEPQFETRPWQDALASPMPYNGAALTRWIESHEFDCEQAQRRTRPGAGRINVCNSR